MRRPSTALRTGFSLNPNAEVANRLLGLDKGSAYVVVADQSHVEAKARLTAVAQGANDTTIRDRHDEIRIGGRLTSKPHSHLLPAGRNRVAKDLAIGPGEVHMLEGAARQAGSLGAASSSRPTRLVVTPPPRHPTRAPRSPP